MTTRIVVCANDYPHSMLPEGTTGETAIAYCKWMQANDPVNIERWKPYAVNRSPNSYMPPPVVYYHWHEIQEIKTDALQKAVES